MSALLLSLPDEAVEAILTHVPLKDRLGSCSLVNSRLRAAAIAATQQLDLGRERLQPDREQALLSWLSVNGQHVTRLEMRAPVPVMQLPSCTNLVDLRLHGGSVQLGGISKLTRLEHSPWEGQGDTSGAISSLSGLVHLGHISATAELPAATLTRLSHLTHLSHYRMSLESLRQLSALTALRELDCRGARDITESPSSVTGLALPPSLTQLELATSAERGVELALLPLAPTGLRALRIFVDCPRAPELEPLLSSVARLQSLTHLFFLYTCDMFNWPPPGPAYSALTASSSLVSLALLAPQFPAGVWPFVFGDSHQLPHLTCLEFEDEWTESHHGCWAFGAADLAALVSCCPRLRKIYNICLRPGAHVSELHKLTALTWLSCYFVAGDPVAAGVTGIAAVTQRRYLHLWPGSPGEPLSWVTLLPLTSLMRLTTLHCAWSDDEDVQQLHEQHCIQTEDGSPPDVWLQLLEHCAAEDPDCHPTVLRGLAQQLAEQRALTAAQAQRTSGLQAQRSRQRQRNKLLQQRHVAAQQQLAMHQEQLSAQQQVAAEQGARIAGLQAQLSAQQQRNEELQQQHVGAQQVAAEQGARITALEGQLQQLLQRLL